MVISKKVAITVKENMIFVFNIFMLELDLKDSQLLSKMIPIFFH